MTAPIQPASFADIGAQSMATVASLDEVTTISAAQTVNGLSTLLVSEGLANLIRDIMGRGPGAGGQLPAPAAAPAAPAAVPVSGAPAQQAAGGSTQTGGDAGGAGGAADTAPAASRDALLGMSSHSLGEMLTRTVISRIVDLNTVNTYLSLASAEQLRQWGKQVADSTGKTGTGPASSSNNGTAPNGGAAGYPGATGPPGPPGYWHSAGPVQQWAGYPARPYPAFVPGPVGYRPPLPSWGMAPGWCPPAGYGCAAPNAQAAWYPAGYPQAASPQSGNPKGP